MRRPHIASRQLGHERWRDHPGWLLYSSRVISIDPVARPRWDDFPRPAAGIREHSDEPARVEAGGPERRELDRVVALRQASPIRTDDEGDVPEGRSFVTERPKQ